LKEIKLHAAEDVKVYLIGNKSELLEEREVTKEAAIEFAQSNNISKVFETSAKTGFNVEEVFTCAGKELYLQVKKEQERERREKEMEEERERRSNQKPEIKGKKLISLDTNKGTNGDGDTKGKKKKKDCC
jgi:GTPase SAR1 family protein